MLNYSCRKQPEFLHVEVFLLNGGIFSQNMLLSAELLNMLNHVLCSANKKKLLSAEMLNMLNVFCSMGPIFFSKGGGVQFFFCMVNCFCRNNNVLLYVELFLQKAAFFCMLILLLKGGDFLQNVLISVEMLNMLNHVLCRALKKRFFLLKCWIC